MLLWSPMRLRCTLTSIHRKSRVHSATTWWAYPCVSATSILGGYHRKFTRFLGGSLQTGMIRFGETPRGSIKAMKYHMAYIVVEWERLGRRVEWLLHEVWIV